MTTLCLPLETISSFLEVLWLGKGPTLLMLGSLPPIPSNGPESISLNKMAPLLELGIQAFQSLMTVFASLVVMMRKMTNLMTFGLAV